MSNRPTSDGGSSADDAADARIDAMARSAGRELRRPAPERGLARIERARRNRQLTRVAGGGAAVLLLIAGGVVALNSGSDGTDSVTADSVVDASQPEVTTPLESVPPQTVPTTLPTITTQPVPTSLPPTAAPSVVYTASGSIADIDRVQTLIDPTSGAVIGTEAVDFERSSAAQAALPSGARSTVDLGDVAYDFRPVSFDGGTLATEFFPDVDLCAQNVVTVRNQEGSTLPERARYLLVTSDDRYVVTLSSDCPEAGTMGADGVGTQLPYDIVVQVFDARHPELAGRTLAVLPSADNPSGITSSGNGRFVAVQSFADQFEYRLFDLVTEREVDLGLDCPYTGANYSRFIGPWVGESSVALGVQCDDGSRLVVRDLMPGGGNLEVAGPSAVDRGFLTVEVDYEHYSTPDDAWFTMCDFGATQCWVGHGNDPLVELAGASEASFLPLGYYPGG